MHISGLLCCHGSSLHLSFAKVFAGPMEMVSNLLFEAGDRRYRCTAELMSTDITPGQ